jgi:hypothetical protein
VSEDTSAWASLLGLLSPSEYFVTVDHSVLWQKHLAWSKPKGEHLRQYVTQRFASDMIVLSLMLGAEIGVFFNSAAEVSKMRILLNTEHYGNLKYWIGIIIALDASVTVMAIIATFTREHLTILEYWIVCFSTTCVLQYSFLFYSLGNDFCHFRQQYTCSPSVKHWPICDFDASSLSGCIPLLVYALARPFLHRHCSRAFASRSGSDNFNSLLSSNCPPVGFWKIDYSYWIHGET